MPDPLFFEDRDGAELDENGEQIPDVEEDVAEDSGAGKDVKETVSRKPVWVDEDDEDGEINIVQVPRRKKLRKSLGETNISGTEYAKRIREFYQEKGRGVWSGNAGWAELPSERRKREAAENVHEGLESDVKEDVSDDDVDLAENVKTLLRSTGSLLSKRKRKGPSGGKAPGEAILAPGVLDLRVLPHANEEEPNRAEARCVEFHPSGRMLLTAGLDKTLRLFLLDGERCSKIQGLHIENFPIRSAKFTGGGEEVVLTGRRRHFHQFDLNSGKIIAVNTLRHHEEKSWENLETSTDGSALAFLGQNGKVVLVESKSKQEIGQLRHNGPLSSAAFARRSENEHHIYTSTLDGTLYLWDVRKMACVNKHKDEGAVHNTSLAVTHRFYAAGSDSGVVNVYPTTAMGVKASMFGIRTEKPQKSLLNLTTQIDDLAFNADGQIMAFSSHVKKGAVRLVHTPSMTVFKNWPSSAVNIGRVCKLAFSPGSGYLAIGNDKGNVHMLRLKAYAAR